KIPTKPKQRLENLTAEERVRPDAGSPVRSRSQRSRACDESSPPILLRLSLHSRRIRVLHFEPIGGAPGTVDGVLALRDDAFEAKLAGMGEDGRAVALDMLVEPDARSDLGH